MPLYSDSLLDDVRNSVNIVSLVSEYVALRKRGRNYVARCPFHTEKTPSFNVNEEKQIFMCFGCGVGGDAFKFVMQVEHLTFPEAVRFLAEAHGISLPDLRAQDSASTGPDSGVLRGAMEQAAEFFHHYLKSGEEGRLGLKYLSGRGIERRTIEQFRLGLSPSSGDALIEHMKKNGLSIRDLEACGLIKRSESGDRVYDPFRGRIMFPITDLRGRIVAFGGRALGDRQPKYLNSPETRLYNKSRNLFGLSHAREAIKKLDYAVLVEGYMDFVVPFQHGIENLVASLGTSLTVQQVQLLGRYTREVIVSYDPDSAGLAATQRSLDLFLEEDFKVRVLRLPPGQDPDAFIRKAGADEYRKLLRDSATYLDFVLDAAVQSQGHLDNPRSKVQVLNTVLPYLAKLPNAVERSDYVFRFARKLQLEDQQLLAEVKRAAQQRRTRLPETPLAVSGSMKVAEKRLLQLLLNNAGLQPAFLPNCSAKDFEGLSTEKIFSAVLEGFRNGDVVTYEGLHTRFAGEPEQAQLAQLQIEDVPEEPTHDTAESFLNALKTMRLASYRQTILKEIAEAVQRKDDEMLTRLIEERILVDRELVSLSRK